MDSLLPIERLHKSITEANSLGDLGRAWNHTGAGRREVSLVERIELIEACLGRLIVLCHVREKK